MLKYGKANGPILYFPEREWGWINKGVQNRINTNRVNGILKFLKNQRDRQDEKE